MTKKITIIGAGPGGYIAAIRAAQLGAEVTVIEEDNIGGTCLNWGCIPSKVMMTTAEMLSKFNRAEEFGIEIDGWIQLNMQRLMKRKKEVILNQAQGIRVLFKRHKINYIKGTGYITGPGRAIVKQQQVGELEVSWDKLILATGTRPSNISAFPFDGDKILSSNHALSLSEIPESIMILGGGVIGCEFAFMFSALGSHVTVVEALSRLLPIPSVDEDCSKVLQREMKKRKIDFIVNSTVNTIETVNGKLHIIIGPSPFLKNLSEKDKEPLIVKVDQMLVCIGRTPNTADIGLDILNVKLDEKGWVVADEQMKTTAPHVYAVGDILGPSKIMLAHVASTEGLVAAENAMGGNRIMDYHAVPGAIFTAPEVANVGLSESQAKQHGFNVRADSVLFRTLGKAQVIGEIAGLAKIVSDAESRKILGVHIIGPHATDLIAEATVAMQLGRTVNDLAETIHAHPTLAEIMLETAFKSLDRSLHG